MRQAKRNVFAFKIVWQKPYSVFWQLVCKELEILWSTLLQVAMWGPFCCMTHDSYLIAFTVSISIALAHVCTQVTRTTLITAIGTQPAKSLANAFVGGCFPVQRAFPRLID